MFLISYFDESDKAPRVQCPDYVSFVGCPRRTAVVRILEAGHELQSNPVPVRRRSVLSGHRRRRRRRRNIEPMLFAVQRFETGSAPDLPIQQQVIITINNYNDWLGFVGTSSCLV